MVDTSPTSSPDPLAQVRQTQSSRALVLASPLGLLHGSGAFRLKATDSIMSGRSSTGSNPVTQPDADVDIPDGMTGTNPQLSEILRQILNRMVQLETKFR